ncbi:MAG: winged helix-turn-helix domain-containing protein [Methanobacteriaceae archaeon]
MKSSKNRRDVIAIIGNDIKIPSEIAKESNLRINHISALLSDLKSEDLVECLNEKSKKGRLYKLTKRGLMALNMVKTH